MKKPKPEPWTPNWSAIPEAAVHQLLSEAKEHLQGTIELGINSDQRSAALCGVFGAAAFALFIVCATVFAGDHNNGVLQWASVIAGLILLASCLLCAAAATPGDFYVSGYEPKLLFPSATDVLWMERYTIEDIQTRIEANRAEINREALLIKMAVRVAMADVAIGLIIAALALLPNTHYGAVSHPS